MPGVQSDGPASCRGRKRREFSLEIPVRGPRPELEAPRTGHRNFSGTHVPGEMDAREGQQGDSGPANRAAHYADADTTRGQATRSARAQHVSAYSDSSAVAGSKNATEAELLPKTFSKSDVGSVVEIECQDDGMLPVCVCLCVCVCVCVCDSSNLFFMRVTHAHMHVHLS